MSDNPTSAENQQERLIKLGWVLGFVDGEGCFSIGFVRQPDRANRRGYRTGYQVAHRFVVTQGKRSLECLYELREFFGIGEVYCNKRFDNHKEDLYMYYVQRREDLLRIIIPFFRSHQLHSAKRNDFKSFAKCVEWMERGYHRTFDGLVQIAKVVQTMNHQKPREALIRILRDHTPNILPLKDDDMVPSA
ncbi:LAGLIDADG family homing endonuclease [Candidatus Peregrinibacteria bacterium]|nr:LAGLIDADG family homing endonuclease [Candidatus Peregrinibacteria bacterium]MBI3816472.1 LAGLIDADG family homing endonuclease [Candidatus Peregrinibacteria bacterium]